MWPFRQAKFIVQRIILTYKFFRFLPRMKELELKWQKKQQIMNDLSYDHHVYEFHEAKGFCDGVKWCLDGKWKD